MCKGKNIPCDVLIKNKILSQLEKITTKAQVLKQIIGMSKTPNNKKYFEELVIKLNN